MLELKVMEGLDHISLSKLKATLDKAFGEKVWNEWEPETISIELGIHFTPLLIDKIRVLQILETDREIFYKDPMFFLYATEVINNEVADFDVTPIPTSLEIAYAIHEVESTHPGVFSYAVKKVITYMLSEEGYSKPVGIFESIVDPTDLVEGQTSEDTKNKERAIAMYITGMTKK